MILKYLRTFLLILIACQVWIQAQPAGATEGGTVTVLCYMNGDNDLTPEVLHALDMMETEGSSERVNVIVLVDGHPQRLAPYAASWASTRLLRLTADPVLGRINSQLLEDWGEADMGDARTLERFVRRALALYPASRYIFYTFAHSKGVIDTGTLDRPRLGKSLAISRDDSSRTKMRLDQFHAALKSGLGARRFDMMILFSCLAGMVETGYAFADITDYLVASEDEIRLLNQPAGRFQIRGLKLEALIRRLKQDPAADAHEIGRLLVDSHLEDYSREVILTMDGQPPTACRFSAGMAMVDTIAVRQLARQLDALARMLIDRADNRSVVTAFHKTLTASQRFASFLNLEYYDLEDFIRRLQQRTDDDHLRSACQDVLTTLRQQVVQYERHTGDCRANGISIYLSNPLVPQNIFEAHQAMYRRSAFSRDTHWDEMIDAIRHSFKSLRAH